MRERDRLEAGMHAQCSEDVANVVAHGLDAQMQLLRDLVRRTAMLEQAEHFGLARRQVRMGRPRRCLVDVGDLSEHADDVVTLDERDCAHLDPDPLAVSSDHDDLAVVRLPRPGEVSREDLP